MEIKKCKICGEPYFPADQEKYGELNESHNQKKIVNLLKEYNTKYDFLITEGTFQNTMESIAKSIQSSSI